MPGNLACGTLARNSIVSGQGSGPDTFELHNAAGVSVALFGWLGGAQVPLGTYMCARLRAGAPMSELVTRLDAGTFGYGCGSVTGYASDAAHMLLTLGSGRSATQFRLEYQFASGAVPSDVGQVFATGAPQTLRVSGREVPPDSGSPNAVNFRDFTVERVGSSCS